MNSEAPSPIPLLKVSHRLQGTVRFAIEELDLNLLGATVLTEAGTNAYLLTPLIAAMAGADKVYAPARDSAFGSVVSIKKELSVQIR